MDEQLSRLSCLSVGRRHVVCLSVSERWCVLCIGVNAVNTDDIMVYLSMNILNINININNNNIRGYIMVY